MLMYTRVGKTIVTQEEKVKNETRQRVYLFVEGRGFHVKGRGYRVEGNFFFSIFL